MSTTSNTSTLPNVAYFCMEFGLSPDLTIYSGGLGILAGDFMKSVGDLNAPCVGIGLLWDKGYTTQTLDDDGNTMEAYPPTNRHALEKLDVEFSVTIRGEDVACDAYRVRYYLQSDLYLIEPKNEAQRSITRSLYGGGDEDRVAQEVLLGVGGVRLLQALGHDVDVYHFNEGHAVFAGHQLLCNAMDAGSSFEDAMVSVRKKIVFTTHTPVPAGNEIHPIERLRHHGAALTLTDEQLEEIGGKPFGMTVAGLRLCRKASAVAQLHGETSRDMWKDVRGAAEITAVTNGVHVPTWQDARIRAALVSDRSPEESQEHLQIAHRAMKSELLDEIFRRTGTRLSVDKLVVGFARRAATYKRADLVLGDKKRLEALFADGLQLVFSGKAHPADNAGKAMVKRLAEASKEYPDNIVFLQDYNMTLGALLTRGCDIWLNNPRRPQEACGTSGMKAAMNGVLNLSILDGWWPEGCEHKINGWQIFPEYGDAQSEEARDQCDQETLYGVLEDDVMPAFANSSEWLTMMKASIEMSQWQFSSDRMVEDYYRILYR